MSRKRGRYSFNKNGEFKDRVRACFERGDAFVAVLFGSDNPDREDDEVERACKEFVVSRNAQFQDAKITILRQNQIAGLLSQYPALALRAMQRNLPNLRLHEAWGMSEIENRGPLKLGPFQQGFLEQIRNELRNSQTATHLCAWGEPGVGKTRLLHEVRMEEERDDY